jgi:hypothetical protein
MTITVAPPSLIQTSVRSAEPCTIVICGATGDWGSEDSD